MATQWLCIGSVILVQTCMAQLIRPWPPPPLPEFEDPSYEGVAAVKMTFPECDCSCCTVEPCPCLGTGNGCSDKLMCFTDKRPECHNWAGQNTEVKYCNVDRTWNLWKSVNRFDVRFMKDKSWYGHDTFCRDFCAPRQGASDPVAGDACDPIPLNTPLPTKKPCPAICACPKKATTTPPPAAGGASLLEEMETHHQTSMLSRLRGHQGQLMSDAELAEQCNECECADDDGVSSPLEWPYKF